MAHPVYEKTSVYRNHICQKLARSFGPDRLTYYLSYIQGELLWKSCFTNFCFTGLLHKCRYSLGSIALWTKADQVESIIPFQRNRLSMNFNITCRLPLEAIKWYLMLLCQARYTNSKSRGYFLVIKQMQLITNHSSDSQTKGHTIKELLPKPYTHRAHGH